MGRKFDFSWSWKRATASILLSLALSCALVSAGATGQTRGDRHSGRRTPKPIGDTGPGRGATEPDAKEGTPTEPVEEWVQSLAQSVDELKEWIQAREAASQHASELRERLTKGMSYQEINALLGVEGRRAGAFSSPGRNAASIYEWRLPDNTRVKGTFKGDSLVEWQVFEYVPPLPKPQLPANVQEYMDASQDLYQHRMALAPEAALILYPGQFALLDLGPRPLFFGENWDLEVGRIGYLRTAKIMQVIDDTSLLATVKKKEYDSPVVMLKEYATAGHVDGEEVAFPMLEVTGTVQYTTVRGGSNTVFVVKPFNIEPFRSAIPASMLDE